MLVETYGNYALLETTCRDWFRCFKYNSFGVEDKKKQHSSTPQKFGNGKLEALLHEDLYQAQGELEESLGVDYTSFEMFESIRNDSKASTLSAI